MATDSNSKLWTLLAGSAVAAAAAVTGYALYRKQQTAGTSASTKKSDSCCGCDSKSDAAQAESKVAADDAFAGFPVFDLEAYLNSADSSKSSAELQAQCKAIADCLYKYGLLIIKDPRVSEQDNDTFINMMERYFEQPREQLDSDIHPEVAYQVGATPNGVERARNHCKFVESLPNDQKPITECPPGVDPKWRFFWRIGERPKVTKYATLAAEPVVPKNFPEWTPTMNNWGGKMLAAVHTVAEMAALGFDMDKDTFTNLFKMGPHLLAPTGSDLGKFGKLGTVFASFHYDLNFLTIHGRSRFPGLYVWTREGKKILVKVPPKCLLLQAGKQFEWMTGGRVLAGFHEVVVVPETIAAIEKAKKENRSTWRISSTLFAHIASDQRLFPLAPFATKEAQEKYPMTDAGEQVSNELKAIKLFKGEIASV